MQFFFFVLPFHGLLSLKTFDLLFLPSLDSHETGQRIVSDSRRFYSLPPLPQITPIIRIRLIFPAVGFQIDDAFLIVQDDIKMIQNLVAE
jgi:hypothetical protein